jgi:hypothetical protein
MNVHQEDTMLHLHKPPKLQHSIFTSLQSSNTPPTPCAPLGPQHLHDHSLNQRIFKSSTSLHASNQASPYHLGLNALLRDSHHSSKAIHPPSKPPTLYVCIMRNAIILSKFQTIEGRKPHKVK